MDSTNLVCWSGRCAERLFKRGRLAARIYRSHRITRQIPLCIVITVRNCHPVASRSVPAVACWGVVVDATPAEFHTSDCREQAPDALYRTCTGCKRCHTLADFPRRRVGSWKKRSAMRPLVGTCFRHYETGQNLCPCQAIPTHSDRLASSSRPPARKPAASIPKDSLACRAPPLGKTSSRLIQDSPKTTTARRTLSAVMSLRHLAGLAHAMPSRTTRVWTDRSFVRERSSARKPNNS